MTAESAPEIVPAPLQGDIAIIGMSCLFAGAPDLQTYWQNILGKVDAISDPPGDEWDPKVFYDPASTTNDRVYCKRGGYIGDLAEFRPLDFGVMPITVDGGEPDQWLALRVAHEALADAGYAEMPKEHVRTEVILGKGTYINRGNLTVGYHGMVIEHVLQILTNLHPEYTISEIGEIKSELKASLPPFSADTAPALIGNIIAGRIANRLDLMGPSFTVDAACASALLAIEVGVRDLLTHKCDLALAGGVNANAPLPTMSLFCQLGALSRQEQIRPFDKGADGTILGEGLGMIVLKRRHDAERDGNRIYAIIKGVGIASDGRALHVMAPRVEGEELALQRAYEMAGCSPTTVGLVEAHGTATPVGDVVELEALRRVFGQRVGSLPSCALGSVKSMIGHTMPAAGIAGVIKSALALYHSVLPPTLNCDEPNPALHLDQSPFYINTETRPWIHGADTPRRAGVNSFGFGGINGHVVLEEYVGRRSQDTDLLAWETEVCILDAASRQELMTQAGRLRDFCARAGEVSLKDLAYSLSCRLAGRPSRLAVVAASKEELAEKLSHALSRLADPKCRQIKDNRGIYFFDEPLAGKLAFVFPGEGAQYPNMLLDLCLHFPEVRSCFDLADRALAGSKRSCLPSEFIFPRSILSKSEQAVVDGALWELDGAVQGVLVSNSAMWTLLSHLEIRPDVIMGHSTGDYSAMLASGVIELTSDASYVDLILAMNETHHRLAEQLPVPQVVLVAVAADSATVMSIIGAVGEELYIAMDNCPHQSVLLGNREPVEKAIEHLRERGLIYEVLPFDRPYHTPLFQAYAEASAEEFFSRVRLSVFKTDLYSCTTAGLYPQDAESIRQLFIEHWVKPVRFGKTIEKIYEDGVRTFVEVGPRGNLTAFVSDILRGKPHLAMPANIARRSGLTQLNHLLGVLAAQGVAMRLDYLYGRRQPKLVDWENATPATPARLRSKPLKLSLAMPPLKVARRERKPVVTPLATAPRVEVSVVKPAPVAPKNAPALLPVAAPPASVPQTYALAASAGSGGSALAPSSAARAMQDYVKSMETFLDVEQQVMATFLNRARTTPAPPPPGVKYPLLGTITSLVPGQELTAVRQLNPDEDLFLRDHALGGPISRTDPTLRPMVVLPLTMAMEILAEAAAALLPGQIVIGMRDVQAHHWIQVDESPVDLRISARRTAGSPNEVEVSVRDQAGTPEQNGGSAPAAVRAIVMFADEHPKPPLAASAAWIAERPSRLASVPLYDGRLMFHGPCFQGVARIDRCGQNGVSGQLRTLPRAGLFRSEPNPDFVMDPVALDAAGQLVGFWAAEWLERGFVVFPYRLDALRLYGPNCSAGELLTCRVTLQLFGDERVRSEIQVVRSDGTVWMELQGWEDRRFDPPARFHRAWTSPGDALISEPWRQPLVGVPGGEDLECCRLNPLFESGASLWKDLWASLVLTRQERRAFRERRGPEKRQLEWLSGRTVFKEAACTYLEKRHQLRLLPADIEVEQDEHGSPYLKGSWTQALGSIPAGSLTHSNGVALALVGSGVNGRRYGIDVQAIRELAPDFEKFAFSADELRLLPAVSAAVRTEWLLRLWCAKEATAKALGRGLVEGPSSVRIVSLDGRTGLVKATPNGKLAAHVPEAAGRELNNYTIREGDYVVATTIYEREKP